MSRDSLESVSFTQFILFLHSVPHLGEKSLARVLRMVARERLSPETCLQMSEDEWIARFDLDPRVADTIVDGRASLLQRSSEMARTLRAYDIIVLTLASLTYPIRLEHNDDAPPPVLYALGNTSLVKPATTESGTIRFNFTVAVSNGASSTAMAELDSVGSTLVQAGGVPVTGHDRTPYKRLALTAQRQNRPILYLFDRGMREALGPEFDRPPFSAARIRDAVFDTDRDLALSPFRLDDHSIGANNLRRDRLIFALSDVIVALDVRPGGNMEAECLRAHRQGTPVFVIEPSAKDGVAMSQVADEGRCSKLRSAGCPILTLDPSDPKALASRILQSIQATFS